MKRLWFIFLLLLSLSFSEELFKLKWKAYVGKENFINNNPIIFGSYVLHATNGDENGKDEYDKLYVFNENGKLLWSFEGTSDMQGVIACSEYILTADDNGYVYALSWDGKLIWRFKASKGITALSLGDIDNDGTPDAVVGSWDKNIYAISGKSGKLLWRFEIGYWILSSPALGNLDDDGYLDVVIGSDSDYIYAISGKGGRFIWKFKTSFFTRSSPALGDLDGDGTPDVVVGSWDKNIYAISGKNGKLIWKFETGNGIGSSPALGDLDGDGTPDVVVGSWDDNIYAISGKTGELIWKFKTDDGVDSSPVLADLDNDNIPDVIVGSGDFNVYVISGKSGVPLWTFKTGGAIVSSPALGDLDKDGYLDLVVASQDGYLYVFEATREHGKVVWSSFYGNTMGRIYYSPIEPLIKEKSIEVPSLNYLVAPERITYTYRGKTFIIPEGRKFIFAVRSGSEYKIFPEEYNWVLETPLLEKLKVEALPPVAGFITSVNLPYVEFILFGATGGEVNRVLLEGEEVEFTPYGKGYLTTPITIDLRDIRRLKVSVELSDRRSYFYSCEITKKLTVECKEFPKVSPSQLFR